MGINGAPWYLEDIGSAIEKSETIIAKIKTNKYDNIDLMELVKTNTEILTSIIANEQ